VSGRAEEVALAKWLAAGFRRIGQIAIEISDTGVFALTHREEIARSDLDHYHDPDDAMRLALFDDQGNYRPLKTAPNLRRGWRLILPDQSALGTALDHFYPGRLAALSAWESKTLLTTPFRETLNRQTGMYRVAAKVTDTDADMLIGNLCRSDTHCLRTILWRRDRDGTTASSRLPTTKFDPASNQNGTDDPAIPLLCQEACNLLVAEARKISQRAHPSPSGS